MMRGLLIALEGIDGSGKSTQAELLAATLQRLGRAVVLTREPTNGRTGQKLRRYLQGPSRHLSPQEELQLFVADRREHVARLVGPALEAGKIVISDRYYYSSVAYQGALGLDPDQILALNESFAPRPALVFVLNLPVPQAMKRLARKGRGGLQVSESPVYLQQVAAIYAGLQGPHIRQLNATLPPARVHQILLKETTRELRRLEAESPCR
ncbi:MAG TPA: dTMP kinase [Desulfobaccales bacterium]